MALDKTHCRAPFIFSGIPCTYANYSEGSLQTKVQKKFLFPFFEKIKDVELCKIISKCLLKFLKIFYQLLKEKSWNLHKFTSQMEP